MIRIVLTLALLALSAREAAAQDTPARLKELVTITAEVVRIGDLVENAGAAAANIAIFRAPDLGQTGTVHVERIAEALRPHDVGALDTAGLSEVVVTRLSRMIGGKEIEERIAKALAGQHGFGEARSIAVAFDREPRPLHVEASATAEPAITRLSFDQRTGRFDISLDVPGSAAARKLPLRFVGTATETVETATLTRAIGRGDTIRESDIVAERRPKAEVAGEAISVEQAIGLSAKRAMRAGAALRSSDLMKADVIARNETVTIVYEAPGIVLTVRGKALEAGAVGDTISVLNIQSNRTVQAEVNAPGLVTINSATPRVAAMAPTSEANRRRRAQ